MKMQTLRPQPLQLLELGLTAFPPSKKNSKRILRKTNGRPFVASSEAFKAWETAQLWQIKHLKPREPIAKAHHIDIYLTPPDRRRRDLTNAAEGVMDLLVLAGFLEDDAWQNTGPLHLYPTPSGQAAVKVQIWI